MAETCSNDPRDAVGEVERALLCLRTPVNQLPIGGDIEPSGLGELLGLIHDRLTPASDALQDYVPRDGTPRQ
jgi:hypothetical protein